MSLAEVMLFIVAPIVGGILFYTVVALFIIGIWPEWEHNAKNCRDNRWGGGCSVCADHKKDRYWNGWGWIITLVLSIAVVILAGIIGFFEVMWRISQKRLGFFRWINPYYLGYKIRMWRWRKKQDEILAKAGMT